ncbi:MAG: hypothetical protein AAGK97_13690, partial [Bacteroidota bacterium]
MWKECGRPVDGWVASIRRLIISNYHKEIKKTKQNQHIIKEKVSNRLKNDNPKSFWKERRTIRSEPNVTASVV